MQRPAPVLVRRASRLLCRLDGEGHGHLGPPGRHGMSEVVHTHDNSWLVGDGLNDPNLPGAVLVDSMTHIADNDPSVADLANLPLCHIAQRAEPHVPWTISIYERLDD